METHDGGLASSRLSNKQAAKTFNLEVIHWRQNAAKLWSTLILFFLILVHSATANTGLLLDAPTVLTNFLSHLLHARLWTYCALSGGLAWLSFVFYDKMFAVAPKCYANNLDRLVQTLYSMHFVAMMANVVVSVLTVYMLLRFYDAENLKAINSFYVLGFCGFASLFRSLSQSLNGQFLLRWPVVEQTKYARFKSCVYDTSLRVARSLAIHLIAWQFVYSVLGYPISSVFFSSKHTLLDDNEVSKVSTWTTLTVAFKLTFIVQIARALSWKLYEIYLTQIYHFSVQPKMAGEIALHTAMSLRSHPYIQTLAMIDLSHLSIYSDYRRSQLFNLTYSGNSNSLGGPSIINSNQKNNSNWSKVCNEAVASINNFMDVFSFDEMLHGSSSSSSKTETLGVPTTVSASASVVNFKSPIRNAASPSLFVRSPIGSPVSPRAPIYDELNVSSNSPSSGGADIRPRFGSSAAGQHQHHHHILSSPSKYNQSHRQQQQQHQQQLLSENALVKAMRQLMGRLKRQRAFAHALNENVNHKTQQMFVDSFMIVNVLRGLSNLAMASLNEDEYGIVQQTLADIITVFIQLQIILEKFNLMNANNPTSLSFKILQKKENNQVELLMQKLAFVLNESIYKITLTFGTSLKSLNLSDDVFKRLHRYYIK